MFKLKYIIISVLLSIIPVTDMAAQSKSTATVLRRKSTEKTETAPRASAGNTAARRANDVSEADTQWLKIVYRDIDLEKGRNGALKNTNDPSTDLFSIMMNGIADGSLPAYEYIDGVERFDSVSRVEPEGLLDRFGIEYTKSADNRPVIDALDMPVADVKRYYMVERYLFDSRAGKVKRLVDAVCPVLERNNPGGSGMVRYPMFWVRLSDINPGLLSIPVMTDDDNNLARHTLDDFFILNLYSGELYKTRNVANKTLMQLFPDPDDLAHARDSIEQRLVAFEKGLWTPAYVPPADGKTSKSETPRAEIKESKKTVSSVKPVKERTTSKRAGAVRSVRRKR